MSARISLSEFKPIKWYRSPIERNTLHKLTHRSNFRGSIQTLGHLGLMAGTAMLTYYMFSQRHWVWFGVALFAHGTVASFMSAAVHELAHGTVFRSKWPNRLFLRIFSLLDWANFHDGLLSHTYHHLYTLHDEADREVILPQTPWLRGLYLVQLFTLNVNVDSVMAPGLVAMVRGYVKKAAGRKPVSAPDDSADDWMSAIYDAHPDKHSGSVLWARFTLLFHLLVVVVAIATQLWLLPVLITLPRWIANWWRYVVFMAMHCGLRDNVADFRKCARTVRLDPISSFLYWRMNWHIEHHMYAAVPFHNLRALHVAIAADQPQVRTLVGAWKEMLSTWRQQKEDPDYQYDTPIPNFKSPVDSNNPDDNDELSRSIGDMTIA